MAEALEKVKKDLGREAVILHTRTIRRGGVFGVGSKMLVEITASRNVNVLHPAERRTVLNRDAEPSRPARSYVAPASSPAIPPTPSPVKASEPATREELSSLTSTFRGEMESLRAMVRDLLSRPASGGQSPTPPPEVPEELRDYYVRLLQSAVADEIAREVITRARERLSECQTRLKARYEQKSGGAAGAKARRTPEAQQAVLKDLVPVILLESIEKMLPPTEPIDVPKSGGPKVVALVGPTGVGKTTTIAKLAAHFKLREHRRVGLITTDTYRIAAVDQLRAYADILDVPLQIVLSGGDMPGALELMRDLDVVLVDTSGRSQNDTHRLGELKTFLDAARAARPDGMLETHLVLSCTSHPGQLLSVAEKFATLGVDRVVFTKLDEAVGLGVILNVSHRLNLQLSYLTTGQDVPDDMEVGHRRRVAELILNRADIKAADSVNQVA
ncbi:MAG: flagellar biosynthesis protein FlhF [Phycisphaerae bacterium]